MSSSTSSGSARGRVFMSPGVHERATTTARRAAGELTGSRAGAGPPEKASARSNGGSMSNENKDKCRGSVGVARLGSLDGLLENQRSVALSLLQNCKRLNQDPSRFVAQSAEGSGGRPTPLGGTNEPRQVPAPPRPVCRSGRASVDASNSMKLSGNGQPKTGVAGSREWCGSRSCRSSSPRCRVEPEPPARRGLTGYAGARDLRQRCTHTSTLRSPSHSCSPGCTPLLSLRLRAVPQQVEAVDAASFS